MSAISTESRFFGLDLNQLKNDIRQTLRKAPQWPPLSWLRPEQALQLLPASGDITPIWESGQTIVGRKTVPFEFWAVELPESLVLRKNLQLPPLDPQDCASAALLEAQSISPFPVSDLLWGVVEQNRNAMVVKLQLVLASRAQVEPYLQSKIIATRQAQPDGVVLVDPELWVFTPQRQPVVFQGFGENARVQAGRRKLLRNAAGVGLALLLLLAIAATPTAQLRLRAVEAVTAYDLMSSKTQDVVAKRERLMQSADQVAGLSDLLAERIDGVKVLSMLTTVLPDDTALQSSRIQGSKVTISGFTENTSALMQKLSSQDGVKDVRAPSAATRVGGGNRENFTIELTLDSKIFGPTLKQEEPRAPALAPDVANTDTIGSNGAAVNQTTPSMAAGAPAAAPPTKPVLPAAPSAGQSKGPTLGGSKAGPSLGGSKPRPAGEAHP